ncbi:MAG: hypothetical protein QW520_01165 [Methanomassiliicoccales archaeon]
MTWTKTLAKRERQKDLLKPADYIGETISIVLILLVALFFVRNQTLMTGFFTSEFKTLEMVLFYGSLLYGMVPAVMRMLTKRRNKVRPFEVLGSIIFIISALYFLSVFPFNMAHLTDLFPPGLRFILDWMTSEIAKLLLAIAVIISALSAAWTLFLYVIVRESMREIPT